MAVIINTQPDHNARAIMAGAGMLRGALDEKRRYAAELKLAADRMQREDERTRILDERYQTEQNQQNERFRVSDQRYASEQAQEQATRQADASLFQGIGQAPQTAQGPTPNGQPMGGSFQEQQMARRQGLDRLLGDPNLSRGAREFAIKEFREGEHQATQAEMVRVATEGLTKTRQMYVDGTRQGVIGEEQAAEVLPFLDPGKYVNDSGQPDISGMLKATAEAEAAMGAARKSYARQQTDDQTLAMFDTQFQTALQAATPAFEMGLYSQGEISEGLNEYNMLRLDWPQLDEQQRSSRAKALIGKLDFRAKAEEAIKARDKGPTDHRSQMAERKAEDLFLRGMEEPGEYDELTKTTGPSTRKTFTYDEALAEAQRLTQAPPPAMPSRQSVLAPGQQQIAPGVSGQVPMGVPQSQPMAPAAAPRGTGSVDQVSDPGAAVRPDPGTIWPSEAPAQPRSAAVQGVKPQAGKRRSRTEILGGDKGPEQDPAPLREAVAKAIALGIPLDQFQDIYGIDLNTLTEEDLREIEAMTGKKRKPAGKKKP